LILILFGFRLHINKELGKIEEELNRCVDCGLLLKSLPELELHTKQHLYVTSFPTVSILSPIYYFNKLIYSETCLNEHLYKMDIYLNGQNNKVLKKC